MINAPAIHALIGTGSFARADLYAITPSGLSTLYWTSADVPITWGGVTYQATGELIDRGRCKLTVGLETDTLDLTLRPDAAGETTVNGIPLRQAAGRGLLDGAALSLSWAYLGGWGTPPAVVGSLLRFVGNFGQTQVGRDAITVTVNSPLKRLDVSVPTKVYGPGCRWTLGDGGCGVNVGNYAQTLSVGTGSTDKTIALGLPSMPQGWAGGKLVLTSGLNQKVGRTITGYANGIVTLATPLPWAPAAGDTVTVTPGCDKVWPVIEASSWGGAVPASQTVILANWVGNGGVAEVGPSTLSYVYSDIYGNTVTVPPSQVIFIDGQALVLVDDGQGDGYMDSYYVTAVTIPGPSVPMTAVSGKPMAGQYSVSSGTYTFAAADVGKSIAIAYKLSAGSGQSCAVYGNIARFGGQPFIPAPETAT